MLQERKREQGDRERKRERQVWKGIWKGICEMRSDLNDIKVRLVKEEIETSEKGRKIEFKRKSVDISYGVRFRVINLRK